MRVHVRDGKIVITDTEYAHRGLYADIPACAYNKHEPGWVAPASPITAFFISKLARENGIPLRADGGFFDLCEEMRDIISKENFKHADSVKLAHNISTDNWLTQTVPWAHQRTAALFCDGMRAAYLAMEMGTGKTIVMVNEILQNIAAGGRRFLIVCPKAVLDVWQAEFKKHAPTTPVHVGVIKNGTNGQKAERVADVDFNCWQRNKPAVVVVNYESLWRDKLGKKILDNIWDMVVLDEAHKIKSPSGKASKYCAKLRRKSRVRRCLSGTPLPNNQLDAYGQWRFLDPGYFGTNVTKFRARYCIMGGYEGHEIVEWKNQSEFRRLLDFLTFRVDKSVLDLPPVTVNEMRCELPSKARGIYNQIENDFIAEVGESTVISMTNVLKRLMKLQQVSSGFIMDDDGEATVLHTGKASMLKEFLEGVGQDEKVVVFCRFIHDLKEVRRVCDETGRLYGELSGRANDLIGGEFPTSVSVLGAQIQAGGIGVNLTAARYCVMYSVGYSLADYLQAEARVHRGGQTRPVTYVKLIADDTIDETVYRALADKKEVVDEILAYIKREKT